METTEVVRTVIVAESAGMMTVAGNVEMTSAVENAETMTADVVVKEAVVDAAITQVAAVETITQTKMDVTVDQISARNPDLNKDLSYSIRIQAADVRNPRITAVIVNSYRN